MTRLLADNAAGDTDLRELPDTETANLGNIAPTSGSLYLKGSPGTPSVIVDSGHDLGVLGGGDLYADGGSNLTLGGTGTFTVNGTGTHSINGGLLDINVNTNLDATLTLINGQTITSTNNGDIVIDPHGTGIVDIGSNFLATGFDLGTPTLRAGTLYANTIDATNIVGALAADGTNANIWAVNQDAVPAVAENVGVMWEATDGLTTLHNWRELTTTSGREFHLQ